MKCPIHVVNDTLGFLQKHFSTYDVITMNDVLEHVPKQEIISFLEAAFEAIIPGGNIVISP